MTDSLWPKLRLKANSEDELIAAYRQVYIDTYVFDEQGMFEETKPLQVIKVYDSNDELLLEAPIRKLQQSKNKHLRKLLNASDFLTEYDNTKYYRLDL